MSTITSPSELRNMDAKDLLREIRTHEAEAAKLRLQIELGTEKNSAKHRTLRRAIARMKTVYGQQEAKGQVTQRVLPAAKATAHRTLKNTPQSRTVRSPKTST